jgi:ParB family chromosome partitioning protein
MSKRFGGLDLGTIAESLKTDDPPGVAKTESQPARTVPIGELAVRGVTAPTSERVTILQVDPKRCRAWKFHDRLSNWYTRERCLDLIESIPKDGQQEAALGRKLEGDPNFDYELIFGMRRRFACESLNRPLKLQITTADDRRAAVLMHIENADRKDITPMERALSFNRQLRENLFRTQDEMAEAKHLSKGMVSQMVKAAEIITLDAIAKLFPDLTIVPISGAYKVAAKMSDPATRDVILSAARHLGKKADTAQLTPPAILKLLVSAPERSKRLTAVKKSFNVGQAGRMDVTRNPQGKVTLAFAQGFQTATEDEVVAAVRRAYQDLGGGQPEEV